VEDLIISADSHVIEVPDLWEKGMPASLRDRAPKAFFDEKRDAWMFGSAEVPVQAVGVKGTTEAPLKRWVSASAVWITSTTS